MEAMKKAASEAVEKVRNSPLFRRKFGTARPHSPLSDGESSAIQQELHPERDLTPFVQGVYFNVRKLLASFSALSRTSLSDRLIHSVTYRSATSASSRWLPHTHRNTAVPKSQSDYCGAPPPIMAEEMGPVLPLLGQSLSS